jgi:hypothetical protein
MGQQAVPLAPHVGVGALGDSGVGTRTAWVVCWIVTVRTTCNKSTCKEEANPREIRCLALSLCAWICGYLAERGGLEIFGIRAVWNRGYSTTIPAPSKTRLPIHAQLDLTTTHHLPSHTFCYFVLSNTALPSTIFTPQICS